MHEQTREAGEIPEQASLRTTTSCRSDGLYLGDLVRALMKPRYDRSGGDAEEQENQEPNDHE